MDITLTGSAGTLTFDDTDILASNGVDVKKTHTGISDFRVTLAGDRAVEPFAARQDKIKIEVDSGTEFLGYVTDASHTITQGSARTTISGYGIAKRLEETRPDYDALGGSLTYSNISVQEALRDYWARTEFTNYNVIDQPLETVATNELVQSADTQSEWGNILPAIADTTPLKITTTGPALLQTAFTVEAENQTTSGTAPQSDANYSDGSGETMLNTGDSITQTFTPEYDIPVEEFTAYIRIDTSTTANPIDVILDGETLGSFNFADGELSWFDIGGSVDFTNYSEDIIEKDTSHTLKFEVASDGNDATIFDVLAPLDGRYSYTFDNNNGGNGGYLDGPELFPPSIAIEAQTSPVSFNIASADLDSVWNDTSNNQSISVSNDGGTTYNTTNNSQTADFSYSGAGREVKTRFTLSRYGSRTSATPQTGYLAQEIDSFEHRVDGDNLAVIVDLELSKNHFDNLQTLHDAGDFVFNIEHDDKAIGDLNVESFRRGSETKTLPVDAEISSNPEINGENYYNSIYIQGALQDDGTRPTAEIEDSQAVSNDGRVISPGVLRDLDISTEGGAVYRARTLLERASKNNALRGTKTYPADFSIQPGYAYEVGFQGDGSTEEFTLEELALRYTGNESTVQTDFIPRSGLSEDVTELKRNSKQQSDRV